MVSQRVSPADTTSGLWGDTVALAAVALLVAAPGLGTPDVLVFDELYYVSDAVAFLEQGVGSSFQAHPPLGSWLLVPGLALLGQTPTAWRLVPLMAGLLSVVLLHRTALRVLGDRPLVRPTAAAAAALLLLDGSWFVLSRTAMLDGLLTTFVLAAVAIACRAADHVRSGRSAAAPLFSAGILVGAATSIKWSGALVLGVVTIEVVRASAAARPAAQRMVSVGLAAVLAYGLTWVPFALGREAAPVASCPVEAAPCPDGGGIRGVVDQHRSLIRYHTSVQFEGGYESDPSFWPVGLRPVTLYRDSCDVPRRPVGDPFAADGSCPPAATGNEDPLSYAGNPAVWLVYVLLLPIVTAAARRGDRAALLSITGWTVMWAPWLLVTRSAFLYYMAPAVPFAALGVATALAALPRTAIVRPVTNGALAAGAAGVAALHPAVPPGIVLLAWGAAGGLRAGTGLTAPSDAHLRAGRLLVFGIVLAAASTFVALRPTWTIG